MAVNLKQLALKKKVAKAALAYLGNASILGIGSGSTITCFIDELGKNKQGIQACVASSETTKRQLERYKIPVTDLNTVSALPIYIDSADEIDQHRQMIKGGGGALTKEKIIAFASQNFICLVDESKVVSKLGAFPIAVEVLPLARTFVMRQLQQLGGKPRYREGFITDNGNVILDVHDLTITNPTELEDRIKLIPGVVESGLFAKRKADIILISTESTIHVIR